MSKGIIVDLPQQLYVSYRTDKIVENEFYFELYKQHPVSEYRQADILQAPFVEVHGFEQLLKIPQRTKEEQDEQLRKAAKEFVSKLEIVPWWDVTYTYHCDTEDLAIVLTCTDSMLQEDFKVKIAADKFVCNSTDTQQPVVLTVHTEGFPELFGETEEYTDYKVCVRVLYAPCITEFMARCGKEDTTGQIYVNPAYHPSITLHWQIMGNGIRDHILWKGGTCIPEASTKDQAEVIVDDSTIYTLEAENQMGFRDRAQLAVDVTGWHRKGKVVGLPECTAAGPVTDRIVRYKNDYYCYQHPWLYQSEDGCSWKEVSKNTKVSQENLMCMDCQLQDGYLYVMAGNEGKRLQIMKYSFQDQTWEASSAYQNCISTDGHLAFSQNDSYYAQTISTGIAVSGHHRESDWMHWNRENFLINTDEVCALYSDLCFWKDRFYAVILCEDKSYYFYECINDMEDAVFIGHTAKVNRIRLLPTTNHLLITVNNQLIDTATRKPVDGYYPPTDEKIVCMGSDKMGVFGIFADGNFWIWQA